MTFDDFLETKSKKELIDIMYEALDLMQQYNGRSQSYCIAMASGCTIITNDDGEPIGFKLPEVITKPDNIAV